MRASFDSRATVPEPSFTFDADPNGSGPQAAHCLSQSLRDHGIPTRQVSLPDGEDPNSFFVRGGDARQFRALLESAAQ